MTRVHFYQIGGDLWDTVPLVAGLIAKARLRSLDVLVYTPDEAFARSYLIPLDNCCGDIANPQLNTLDGHLVSLGWDAPGHHHGLVINLTDTVPLWFSRFERMAEVVYDVKTVIDFKRQNFRYYRDRGYPLHYHDLSQANTMRCTA